MEFEVPLPTKVEVTIVADRGPAGWPVVRFASGTRLAIELIVYAYDRDLVDEIEYNGGDGWEIELDVVDAGYENVEAAIAAMVAEATPS